MVHSGLPFSWVTWYFFFHLKILVGIWGLWPFLNVPNTWKFWMHSTLHKVCAQTPIPLVLLCSGASGHLRFLIGSHFYTSPFASNVHVPESWQKLHISRAKIWLKAVCISQELCTNIPALSRGVMSFSLILALWKEQMVPRSCTSEPVLQLGASCIIFITSRVSQTPSSLHLPL